MKRFYSENDWQRTLPLQPKQNFVLCKVDFPKWGCGHFLGLDYATNPRLLRYSTGLRAPRDILIRLSLYHRM